MIKELIAFTGIVSLASVLVTMSMGTPNHGVVEPPKELANTGTTAATTNDELWEHDDGDGGREASDNLAVFGEPTMDLDQAYGDVQEKNGNVAAAASPGTPGVSPTTPQPSNRVDQIEKMNQSPPKLAE